MHELQPLTTADDEMLAYLEYVNTSSFAALVAKEDDPAALAEAEAEAEAAKRRYFYLSSLNAE